MNFKSTIPALLLLAVCYLSGTAMRDPNGPPAGRTGAPGETTCGASGCHTGGAFTGTISINGLPDTVVANQSYMVTLNHASNATKAGFELTCLDSINLKAGTLTAGSGSSLTSGGGRQYVRQSSPKTLSNGSTAWTFSWKAPAAAAGNKLTFYSASLAANGNGQRTGDNPLLGTRNVVLQTVSPTTEPAETDWVKLYPTTVHGWLHIDLKNGDNARARIFDQQGKITLETSLNAQNQLAVSALPKGLYVTEITAEGKVARKRFVVE